MNLTNMKRIMILVLLTIFYSVSACNSEPLVDTVDPFSHSDSVHAVAIDPTGKYIVSGSGDKTLRVWELESGKLLNTILVDPSYKGPANAREAYLGIVYAVAIDPSGKYIVSGNHDSSLKIWDLETGELLNTLKGHIFSVKTLAIDPTGKYIVSGSQDDTLKIWELRTGRLVNTLEGHSGSVGTLSIDSTGKYIVSGNWDNTLQLWELKTGELVDNFKIKYSVYAIAIDPSGNYIVSGNSDRTVKIWALEGAKKNGKPQRIEGPEKIIYGHSGPVMAIAIDPTGKYIVSGSRDNTLKIWDFGTGKLVNTLSGHSDAIISVAIDPTGKYIVSGSRDKTIKVWEFKTGTLLNTL